MVGRWVVMMSVDRETQKAPSTQDGGKAEFEMAADEERIGLLAEFWDFLKHNKKWWLLPPLVVLLLLMVLGLLSAYGGGASAPFLYPMF